MGFSMGGKRSKHDNSGRGKEPWNTREPGDTTVRFREEFLKPRNYVDVLRGTVGSLAIMGGMNIDACIAVGDNVARGGDQIAQAMWALSTGGIFGTGIGLGDTRFVPAGYTDLPLAAIGEELGFIGLLCVVGAFVVLGWRGFRTLARRKPPPCIWTTFSATPTCASRTCSAWRTSPAAASW